MGLSIRNRTVLAMTVLVTCVGVAVGWASIEVSARAIERRLIGEPVRGTARLVGAERLPITNKLMTNLKQILGTEFAAGPVDASEITAASLSPELRRRLADQLAGGRLPDRVMLAGEPYRVGTGLVEYPDVEARPPMRLFLLLPESQLTAAQDPVKWTIVWITAGAVLAAGALGFWVSHGVTRPVSRLAERMDRLARAAASGELPERIADADARSGVAPDHGPAELARLAESYDHLLAQLSEARGKLSRSARLAALGQLSASVAHELRNPLSGIKMNVRVLADELAAASISDPSLDLIVREIDRMDLYVSQLLSAASGREADIVPPSGGGEQVCDLADLVESVLPLVAPRCEQMGIEIVIDTPASPCRGRTTERAVRQVVVNLLLNAMDAMGGGGSIRIRASAGEGDTVRLAITDSGPGMTAGQGADVFEPFVTSKSDGAGLGLYICKQIVTAQGGRIGYQTAAGGTTFWFELPSAEAPGHTGDRS